MHRGGEDPLRDIDWTERRWDTNQAYSDSKLYVTALAFAVAQHMAEGREQCRRSRLGADEDGRSGRAG